MQLNVERVPVISVKDLDYIFTVFLVDKKFYLQFKTLFTSDVFKVDEEYYNILNDGLAVYVDRLSESLDQPTDWLTLDAILSDILETKNISIYDEAVVLSLQQPDKNSKYKAIYTARKVERDGVAPLREYAEKRIKRFLEERLYVRKVQELVVGGGLNTYREDLSNQIRALDDRLIGLKAVGESPFYDLAPADNKFESIAREFIKTNVPFIDIPLNGFEVGGVSGLVGASGAGKTTYGIQACVSAMKREYDTAIMESRLPRKVYYFTYEEAAEKLRSRVISCACNISRTHLDSISDLNEGLRREVQPYQRALERNQNEEDILTEWERWLQQKDMLTHFRLTDVSGSKKSISAGEGYVDEVVAILSKDSDECGLSPLLVCFDYAGLMCDRYANTHNYEEKRAYNLLKGFADTFRFKVAEKFNCAVLALHQLAADQNTNSPKKKPSAFDAGGARSFITNMAVAGALGTKDPQTGIVLLSYSKIRYRQTEDVHLHRLKIHNDIAMFEDVTSSTMASQLGDGFSYRNEIGDSMSQLMSSVEGRRASIDVLEQELG